ARRSPLFAYTTLFRSELDGDRYLPIWIGAPEATSIATALEKVTTPRPLTHDLLRSVIDVLGAVASRVVITEMRDSIFFADITFEDRKSTRLNSSHVKI